VAPQRDEKLEQLEKLLNSRILHGSDSLRAFLKFVVLKSIDDHQSPLKEYTIATEVFGRGPNYDSRSDSAVRVQAGRLRAKLHEYYATEGRNDRVLIDLPKGHYSPSFSYVERTQLDPERTAESGNGASGHPTTSTRSARKMPDSRLKYTIGGIAILGLLIVALAISNGVQLSRLKPSSAAISRSLPVEIQSVLPLWNNFLRTTDPVLVAFSNTRFEGTAESGMKLLKPMGAQETNVSSSTKQAPPITEHYTGVGEVMGVYALGEFFHSADHAMRLKRSLLLTWDDLKNYDIVVLGSPAENYLLRDLPQQQDFIFGNTGVGSEASAFGVTNTKPAPNEHTTYLARQEGPSRSQISEDYAVISLLRGLDENHRLLILAGITTYGTQAAAEYVTKTEHINELISHLNTAKPGEPPQMPAYFQVLVRVKVNDGVPVQISYVTHHVL
jgi:hypothetical protein